MSEQIVNHQQQEQLIANSKETESLYSTDWKHYDWIHFGHYLERLDRMYYNVLLTRNSITIQSSSNVLMMRKRR